MHTAVDSNWLLPVLTYHRIGEPSSRLEPPGTVSPKHFEEQLKWLKCRGYTTITATQLHEVLCERAVVPPRTVLLTFDDGYADLCDYALPALTASGFSGTVFIVTARVGQTNTWDQVLGWNSLPLMSADQIRYWSGQGIDFGAHSQTHPDLTTLSGAELGAELAGSAHELGCILRRPVISFAYPHGAHNAGVRSVAARYFELAFASDEGLTGADTDPFRIRRTMVQTGDGVHAFSCRVSRGRSPLYDVQHWRARMRVRSRGRKLLTWLMS